MRWNQTRKRVNHHKKCLNKCLMGEEDLQENIVRRTGNHSKLHHSSRLEASQHHRITFVRTQNHRFRVLRGHYGQESNENVQCRLSFLHGSIGLLAHSLQLEERQLVTRNDTLRDAAWKNPWRRTTDQRVLRTHQKQSIICCSIYLRVQWKREIDSLEIVEVSAWREDEHFRYEVPDWCL